MDKNRIAEIRARCEAASPGTWTSSSNIIGSTARHEWIAHINDVNGLSDLEFVKNSRQDIPALLDYVEELQADMEDVGSERLANENIRLVGEMVAAKKDRDQYKEKAEALERAIVEHSQSTVWDLSCVACYTCGTDCKKGACEDDFSSWQFDIERFAGKKSQ